MALRQFDGKIAIVTGASRGIGRAIALRLAAGGATVVCVARGSNADATAAEITEGGGVAFAHSADVTDAAAVDALIKGTVERHGRLDILVSNAGITRDQLMLRMKRADWDDVLATNLTAAFTLCQAALKPMIKQRAGRIVAISSVVGQMGNAGQANYAASKAGLIGFCKALAREVASRQVTVNVVAPGLVETDMTRAITADAKTDWSTQIPLGRLGSPNDIVFGYRQVAAQRGLWHRRPQQLAHYEVVDSRSTALRSARSITLALCDSRLHCDGDQSNSHRYANGERGNNSPAMALHVLLQAIAGAAASRGDRLQLQVRIDVAAQRFDRGVAPCWFALERLQYDRIDVSGQPTVDSARARSVYTERTLTGEQFVQHQAELINIGRSGDRFASQLFGRGVCRRQQAMTELRSGRSVVFELKQARNPEVDQLHLAARRDQDVVRLEVAVHDQAAVRVLDRAADIAR
jgi:3-oxoacyl-[acyl-carrier protein] reductase